MRKTIYLAALILIGYFSLNGQTVKKSHVTNQPEKLINLLDGWKFKTGDNSDWAKIKIDDSQWSNIDITNPWEKQGFKGYDGYAWYRIKIVIPSSLSKVSFLKDSIQFILGKIDDCDQFYLNGIFIGENNKITTKPSFDETFEKEGFYGEERRYVLSVKNPNIHWNKENIIAVRVFDHGSNGGFYNSQPCIRMLDIRDKKIVDNTSRAFTFTGNKVQKRYIIKNSTDIQLKGTYSISAYINESRESILNQQNEINLKPGESKEFAVSFGEISEAVSVKTTFKHNASNNSIETFEQIPFILTPQTGNAPHINGTKVVGVRPGKPFVFYIPVTGIRPMNISVKNLPEGLILHDKEEIITGKVTQAGDYLISITAQNSLGSVSRDLVIKVGDQIALTPPMGWNSWNCWGLTIDQNKVIASAHVFKDKGLMNHGWAFINIDDGWQASRDKNGEITSNEKFPNMQALGDSLHNMGLKFGIYSSPGTMTCGGYTGSYEHETQDARTYAKWGVDYLKHDWCSYSQIAKDNSVPELKKPYQIMQKALSEVDRDIIYSLCQYGRGNVWEWGSEVGGNLWRTTGDISESWTSMSKIGFNQIENAPYAGPGHWNDPDMLIVGWIGWGPSLHPTKLSVNEQYTHISLWSLLAAPLLIGCDLTHLDDFTLNLLTNDEVIAINQDPLGKQATPKFKKENVQIWVKELEDGSKAVGVFNLGDRGEKISVNLSDLGLSGQQIIRDVWRQKDLGAFNSTFETYVGRHGVMLIKVSSK